MKTFFLENELNIWSLIEGTLQIWLKSINNAIYFLQTQVLAKSAQQL